MSWTCLNSEERLMEYLEGQLPATERALVEAHLAECAACRALAGQVRWLETRLPHLAPELEPAWLVPKILQATTGAERKPRENLLKTLVAALTSPRFALGLGTVAATIFILFQALGINPKKITADDLNPVNLYRMADRQAHLTYARGVRFVNDMRVVYEIRSRLQEASATPNPPAEQESPKSAPSPQSEHQLKNDLLRRGPAASAALLFLPPGGPR
ncbi:MAG TPA: zf-HC2 domain-containing protein [Candidatus Acidoferrales bacterium]|nr:zf-HC2 domain-containing protein [Candidatus Acidoferrales bacterium]